MGLKEQEQRKQTMVFKFHFHVPNLHILHNHHNHHNHHHDVPKGCVAIMVGHEGDEEGLHRFVIPLMFLSHPLFMRLLKEAEEVYGFRHEGPITIPCRVDEFKHVQDIIDEETRYRHGHGHGHGNGNGNGHNNHNHHHHNNNNHLRCF